MTDPPPDIASQLDQLCKEQQARAADKKRESQSEIGPHTLRMLLVILCGLVGGLIWALAERYRPSP